jgi:hypothetical protein
MKKGKTFMIGNVMIGGNISAVEAKVMPSNHTALKVLKVKQDLRILLKETTGNTMAGDLERKTLQFLSYYARYKLS